MRKVPGFNDIPIAYRMKYKGRVFFKLKNYKFGAYTEFCEIDKLSKEGKYKHEYECGIVEEGTYKNNFIVGISRRVYPDGRILSLDYASGDILYPVDAWPGEANMRPAKILGIERKKFLVRLALTLGILGVSAGGCNYIKKDLEEIIRAVTRELLQVINKAE